MESQKKKRPASPSVDRARKLLILADDVMHVVVAVFLVAAAFIMLGYAAKNFLDVSVASILHVVNDVLLVLIIAEVLWTIIRYLRREEFSLAPFLFIGIISSIRRILFIDAEMSMGTSPRSFNENVLELGIHVSIIFILVVAYFLVRKARAYEE